MFKTCSLRWKMHTLLRFVFCLSLATIIIASMWSISDSYIGKRASGISRIINFVGEQRCAEMHDIVYLKVHKTGSSTIANVLQRFGYNRRLNFALPNKTKGEIRYNYFGKLGGTLNKTGILSSKKNAGKLNIMYNHVIYNWKAFESIFPHNRTTYVTMLRDPLTQFSSTLLFFRHKEIFTATTENLTSYLEHPERHEPKDPYVSFTDNRQALDLGMPPKKLRDNKFIPRYINMLDRTFNLVLIMEYFDESLIMLKRHMCWSFKDILYIKKNKAYRSFDFRFGVREISLLKKWLVADQMMYAYFYMKFHLMIKKDPLLMEEAHWFKVALVQTQNFCNGSDTKSRVLIKSSPWNSAFYVTSLDCAYMNLGELDFLNKLLHH